ITNAGTITWAGTGSLSDAGGVIVNDAGGLLDFQSDVSLLRSSITPTITNAGILRKSAGTGSTLFSGVTVDNSGTIDVRTGRVALGGGGAGTGTFIVAAAASLYFSGGTYTFQAGIQFPGAGYASVVGGSGIVAAPLTVTNFEVGGDGRLDGPAN